MKSIIHDLSVQLSGQVTASKEARDFFSTDGSIFKVIPQIVIYPRHEDDVVKTVKYLNWQAQEGKKVSLTARGKGTDQAGGSLGDGAMLVFPAAMKGLKDITANTVTVEPGMIYSHLQGILHSHWRFLPPYPASMDYCTVGGAVANNSSGEKTLKYGATRNWVKSLKVVLSNGDVIITKRLNKKELKKKQAQSDFEGHLYRTVDALLIKNSDTIHHSRPKVSKNSAGYDLWDVKGSDGSFDMGQLIVGSQGTLGIVSEITFHTAAFSPQNNLVVAHFDDLQKSEDAVHKILTLGPSALEMVDYHTLDFVRKNKPEMLKGINIDDLPKLILLAEFDDVKPKDRIKKANKAAKILAEYTSIIENTDNLAKQDELWQIRRGAAALIWTQQGAKKALPIIEDGVVPVEKMTQYLEGAYALFEKYGVKIATWGHAGNANLHIQPFLDLSNMRDRAKIFELTDDYYKLVIKLGGSITAEHNDGIMRGPYLKDMFGSKVYSLFEEVKDLFDPLGFLNPGVKLGVTKEDAMVKMRKEYSMNQLFEHLPGNYNH
ncbi:MAG: FAD-binding oxidoreductase [Patescibacteria group bacterium]|nr:FAD-binding oxidoreductase [Patescibacteria group bacterium]